jgi:hypothetical protein
VRAASIYLHSSAERKRAIADRVGRNAKKDLAKSKRTGQASWHADGTPRRRALLAAVLAVLNYASSCAFAWWSLGDSNP